MLVFYAFKFVHCIAFYSSATEAFINNNNNNNNDCSTRNVRCTTRCVRRECIPTISLRVFRRRINYKHSVNFNFSRQPIIHRTIPAVRMHALIVMICKQTLIEIQFLIIFFTMPPISICLFSTIRSSSYKVTQRG